jgi:septum formation topological specificity factor MinE
MNPESPRLPVLLQHIRQEIREKARPNLVNDLLAALEMYIEVSERTSKT